MVNLFQDKTDRLVIVLTFILFVSCDSLNKRNTDNSDLELNKNCPESFQLVEGFQVLNSRKIGDGQSSLTDTTICKGWTLTTSEIEKIIKDSEIISGPDWHHMFDHLPCSVTGQLRQNKATFDFQINAGSWLTITCKDSAIILGNFNRDNEHLFISTALDKSDE